MRAERVFGLRRATATAGLLGVAAVLLAGWGGSARENGRLWAAAGSTVDITASDQASLDRFVEAVATPGTTVRLAPDVALDLTGHTAVVLAAGVTVTSWRSAVPGVKTPLRDPDGRELGGEARTPLLPGPRIYTTKPNGVFEVLCSTARQDNPDHVRISGLRLIGPNQNVVDDDAIHPIAIKIDSCVDIEISNMEIAGWSGTGVYVDDTYHRIGDVDQIRIHDNFIHHNQHRGREGYGVAVETGAWAQIERTSSTSTGTPSRPTATRAATGRNKTSFSKAAGITSSASTRICSMCTATTTAGSAAFSMTRRGTVARLRRTCGSGGTPSSTSRRTQSRFGAPSSTVRRSSGMCSLSLRTGMRWG